MLGILVPHANSIIVLIDNFFVWFKHCKGQTIVAIKRVQELSPRGQARGHYEWLIEEIHNQTQSIKAIFKLLGHAIKNYNAI